DIHAHRQDFARTDLALHRSHRWAVSVRQGLDRHSKAVPARDEFLRSLSQGRILSGQLSGMGSSRIEGIASLDLVRGAAAFCVAIPHYFVLNSTDWPTAEAVSVLSVEVFFILSGFVLAPQIMFCSRDGRLVNLLIFLVRRWMRTILPFLVALAA